MRVKTGRSWGPDIPVRRGWGEVAWQPRGILTEVTGERHSTRLRTGDDDSRHRDNEQVEPQILGLTSVVE